MGHGVSEDEFERFLLSDNTVGLVDLRGEHVSRVAEILAERHPGIIFLWPCADAKGIVTLLAAKPNKGKFGSTQEEKLVAAAERIAKNVAAKHPAKAASFFERFFRKAVQPGWWFTEKK